MEGDDEEEWMFVDVLVAVDAKAPAPELLLKLVVSPGWGPRTALPPVCTSALDLVNTFVFRSGVLFWCGWYSSFQYKRTVMLLVRSVGAFRPEVIAVTLAAFLGRSPRKLHLHITATCVMLIVDLLGGGTPWRPEDGSTKDPVLRREPLECLAQLEGAVAAAGKPLRAVVLSNSRVAKGVFSAETTARALALLVLPLATEKLSFGQMGRMQLQLPHTEGLAVSVHLADENWAAGLAKQPPRKAAALTKLRNASKFPLFTAVTDFVNKAGSKR